MRRGRSCHSTERPGSGPRSDAFGAGRLPRFPKSSSSQKAPPTDAGSSASQRASRLPCCCATLGSVDGSERPAAQPPRCCSCHVPPEVVFGVARAARRRVNRPVTPRLALAKESADRDGAGLHESHPAPAAGVIREERGSRSTKFGLRRAYLVCAERLTLQGASAMLRRLWRVVGAAEARHRGSLETRRVRPANVPRPLGDAPGT
jgi:hypothetical protein